MIRPARSAAASLEEPSTLVDLLRWRAVDRPEQIGFSFLLDGERAEVELSYGALDLEARAIAGRLAAVCAAGDRALLLFPPGLAFLGGFFGSLYGGTVAVPAYPPHPARFRRSLSQLRAIAADARPAVVLTTSEIRHAAEPLLAEAPELSTATWLATDELDRGLATEWRAPTGDGGTLALLQYTSGATATPKGVMITHGNLLYNSELIRCLFEHTPASRGVIWLPPYHDMGLIGGILQPLYAGFPVTLMAPLAFLQRPFRWLQAVSRHRASTSGGPNFAYELCIRKTTPEQRRTLDLSSWEVAFCGAEPVRSETLDRFAEVFAPSGFRREAFYPCFGLAEATLLVSGGRKALPPVVRSFDRIALAQGRAVELAANGQGRTLTGCGEAPPGQRILIADPGSGEPLPPGCVGEICVAGPSVARGYWDRPEETERAFHRPAGARSESFLRTGDLGFLSGGELFVTGRLKDVLIVDGRNHYCQDIEAVAEACHPALRAGGCAAFSVDRDGEEQLVILAELPPRQRPAEALPTDLRAAIGAIRQAVAEQHDLRVHAVCFVATGSLPRTSSGKLRRGACREGYLAGSLERLEP